MLLVFKGPKRSIWRSSGGIQFETIFFYLNETLVCFPIWHASHKWYFMNFIFGRTIAKYFEVTLFCKSKLIWFRRLCHNQEFSLMVARHLVPTKDASSKLSIYVLLTLKPLNIQSFFSLCSNNQQVFVKVTLNPCRKVD